MLVYENTTVITALLTCPEDTGVAHSRALLDPQLVGSSTEVECEVGYNAQGNMTAYCQDDQSWSVPEGQCQSKQQEKRNDPPHDKTNKMICAPSKDSDQPGHLPSLIRVFAVCSMGS